MKIKHFALLFLLIATIYSCRKMSELAENKIAPKTGWLAVNYPEGFFKEYTVPGVATHSKYNTTAQRLATDTSFDPNNGDDSLVLGQQLNNPYTVGNMRQAYYQLYGDSSAVQQANYLYVRFKPNDIPQLQTLLSNTDLELQDYPMDYEVVEDGDFYQDPNLTTEEIGWLYTAVPIGYTPPSGIPYQVLEQLYIPTNNDLAVELMAESLAAGGSYRTTTSGDTRTIERTDVPNGRSVVTPNLYPTPCEMDPCGPGCPLVEDGCAGPGGNPTDPSGGNNNDPRKPRGRLQVQDIVTCNGTTTNVPVRQARIICKRWFKIDRMFTTDAGNFAAEKKFNNKVKILYKTENSTSKTSKIRGIRLWQILFPVKKRIGVFDRGAMANVNHIVEKPANASAHSKELPYWVAATTHNSILEFGEYADEINVGKPPTQLHILISNWSDFGFRAIGATPMWNKCGPLPQELNQIGDYIRFFAAGINASIALSLVGVLKNETDVLITYSAPGGNYDCRLTSRDIKEIAYHEFGHAAHFAQAGCGYWQDYRTRISNEIVTDVFGDPTSPYGDGTETNAGVVGLGEMWGNHCGYTFTNRRYGNGGNNANPNEYIARIQAVQFGNDTGPFGTGLNAYLWALENFNPNRVADVHRWIPQGLPYDLIDNRNEANNPITDNVSGYTNQQIFNALQSDVRSLPAFRNRLLQQNNNMQQAQVNALFNEYNY